MTISFLLHRPAVGIPAAALLYTLAERRVAGNRRSCHETDGCGFRPRLRTRPAVARADRR